MKIVEFIKSIISILRDEEHLWLITILATGAVTLVKIVDYFVKDGQSKADNLHTNFNATLNGLKSSNETERITSAILLRRYINDIGFFKKATRYKKDTLNVILLRRITEGSRRFFIIYHRCISSGLSVHKSSKCHYQSGKQEAYKSLFF